jgi:hypothetical protein
MAEKKPKKKEECWCKKWSKENLGKRCSCDWCETHNVSGDDKLCCECHD